MATGERSLTITVDAATRVSARIDGLADARACLLMAHGAGSGMDHPFLAAFALDLARSGIACLRFQFPYMENCLKRVDPPARCHAAIRAAVAAAHDIAPGLPLFAGGKSFGGRMTSQAQALQPLPQVVGLILLGFPLHLPKKPSLSRAEHLTNVKIPMLFLQGTRDALAEMRLLHQALEPLGDRATLGTIAGADHSFHVLRRSGRTDLDVRQELMGRVDAWVSNR
ncbi:MAG: alpha/beta hydrolase [Steroidobacteraceae bacterium]